MCGTRTLNWRHGNSRIYAWLPRECEHVISVCVFRWVFIVQNSYRNVYFHKRMASLCLSRQIEVHGNM